MGTIHTGTHNSQRFKLRKGRLKGGVLPPSVVISPTAWMSVQEQLKKVLRDHGVRVIQVPPMAVHGLVS